MKPFSLTRSRAHVLAAINVIQEQGNKLDRIPQFVLDLEKFHVII